MCTNIAASTAMTATVTHRPGWRTGTARMLAGRSPLASAALISGRSHARVDFRVGDGALLDTPLRQDLLVGAVGDQRCERPLDRLPELLLALWQDVAVRSG